MTKQEEFLWIVQTAVLGNGLSLSSTAETREKYRHEYSSTGVRILMREAVRASSMIPDNMDVGDAADEFCIWMFSTHQEILKRENPKANVPSWFAR